MFPPIFSCSITSLLKQNHALPGFSYTSSLLFRCMHLFNRCLSAHCAWGGSGGQNGMWSENITSQESGPVQWGRTGCLRALSPPREKGVIQWGWRWGWQSGEFGLGLDYDMKTDGQTEPWPETYFPESVLYVTVYKAPSHMPILWEWEKCKAWPEPSPGWLGYSSNQTWCWALKTPYSFRAEVFLLG